MFKSLERESGRTRLAASALALVLSCSAANAQTDAAADAPTPRPLPPGAIACDFVVFSNDYDPAGLNVRAEPDEHARVLGRLPPPIVYSRDSIWYASAEVIGFKKGWFLIENGSADTLVDENNKSTAKFAPYTGRGWVSGNLLTAQLGSPLKAAPRAEAAEPVDVGFYQDVKARRLLSCSGPWLHVEIALPKGAKPPVKNDAPPGAVRGWVYGTCGEQRTTCDFGNRGWPPPAPLRRCRRSRGTPPHCLSWRALSPPMKVKGVLSVRVAPEEPPFLDSPPPLRHVPDRTVRFFA